MSESVDESYLSAILAEHTAHQFFPAPSSSHALLMASSQPTDGARPVVVLNDTLTFLRGGAKAPRKPVSRPFDASFTEPPPIPESVHSYPFSSVHQQTTTTVERLFAAVLAPLVRSLILGVSGTLIVFPTAAVPATSVLHPLEQPEAGLVAHAATAIFSHLSDRSKALAAAVAALPAARSRPASQTFSAEVTVSAVEIFSRNASDLLSPSAPVSLAELVAAPSGRLEPRPTRLPARTAAELGAVVTRALSRLLPARNAAAADAFAMHGAIAISLQLVQHIAGHDSALSSELQLVIAPPADSLTIPVATLAKQSSPILFSSLRALARLFAAVAADPDSPEAVAVPAAASESDPLVAVCEEALGGSHLLSTLCIVPDVLLPGDDPDYSPSHAAARLASAAARVLCRPVPRDPLHRQALDRSSALRGQTFAVGRMGRPLDPEHDEDGLLVRVAELEATASAQAAQAQRLVEERTRAVERAADVAARLSHQQEAGLALKRRLLAAEEERLRLARFVVQQQRDGIDAVEAATESKVQAQTELLGHKRDSAALASQLDVLAERTRAAEERAAAADEARIEALDEVSALREAYAAAREQLCKLKGEASGGSSLLEAAERRAGDAEKRLLSTDAESRRLKEENDALAADLKAAADDLLTLRKQVVSGQALDADDAFVSLRHRLDLAEREGRQARVALANAEARATRYATSQRTAEQEAAQLRARQQELEAELAGREAAHAEELDGILAALDAESAASGMTASVDGDPDDDLCFKLPSGGKAAAAVVEAADRRRRDAEARADSAQASAAELRRERAELAAAMEACYRSLEAAGVPVVDSADAGEASAVVEAVQRAALRARELEAESTAAAAGELAALRAQLERADAQRKAASARHAGETGTLRQLVLELQGRLRGQAREAEANADRITRGQYGDIESLASENERLKATIDELVRSAEQGGASEPFSDATHFYQARVEELEGETAALRMRLAVAEAEATAIAASVADAAAREAELKRQVETANARVGIAENRTTTTLPGRLTASAHMVRPAVSARYSFTSPASLSPSPGAGVPRPPSHAGRAASSSLATVLPGIGM
jgi:hypothetical protein